MVVRVFAMLVVLCVASTAHAESSENTAVALSLAPTVAGAGLVTTAAIWHDTGGSNEAVAITATTGFAILAAGPTLGHLYAGRAWSRGLAVRLVGATVMVPGMLLYHYGHECGKIVCGAEVGGAGLFAAGGITIAIGAIMDVVSAPELVRAHNASLVITPTSVALAGTF